MLEDMKRQVLFLFKNAVIFPYVYHRSLFLFLLNDCIVSG